MHSNDTKRKTLTMKEDRSKLKPLLFFFNLFFFFAGFAIFIIGSWVSFSEFHIYTEFLSNNKEGSSVSSSGYILIGLGLFMTVVYFLGCCGTCSESAHMLYTFSVIVFILIVMEISIAVVFLVFKGHAKDVVMSSMEEGITKYNSEECLYYKEGWDRIQARFQCCGLNNQSDWKSIGNLDVPSSCKTGSSIHAQGCYQIFEVKFEEIIEILGALVVAIACLQFCFNLLACYFGKKASEGYNNWYSMLSYQRYHIF